MIFLFAFHLILRVILIAQSQHTFYSDDAIYASLARMFLEGDFTKAVHPTWPPLYPFLGAALKTIFPWLSWEHTMRFVSALAGSLTLFPLFAIFRNFTKRYFARLLAFVVLFTQPFLLYSILPYSDALATLLALVAISFALNSLQGNNKAFIISGIATGAMYLTRSEGTLFFGVFLMAYLFYTLTKIKRRKQFSRALVDSALFVAAFFIVASPYIVVTAQQFGRLTLSPKFSAQIKQGHSFELREGTTWSQEAVSIKSPNYSSLYFSGGLKHIIRYSDWYWFWFIQKAQNWYKYTTAHFPPLVIVLILAGVVLLYKKSWRGRGMFLGLICTVGVTMTVFATPLTDIRYLLWMFPLLILALAMTVITVFRSSLLSILIVLALVYISDFISLTYLNTTSYAADYNRTYFISEIHTASDWINAQSTKNPRIMMRHEGIEFYTNGETVYMPQISVEKLILYAKEKKVDYIVAWDKELIGDAALVQLTSDVPNGLTRVFPEVIPAPIQIFTLSSQTMQ